MAKRKLIRFDWAIKKILTSAYSRASYRRIAPREEGMEKGIENTAIELIKNQVSRASYGHSYLFLVDPLLPSHSEIE